MKVLSRILLAIGIIILVCSTSYASLTAGQTYTIEIYAIQSNGTPAASAAITTTATANGDGKISFTLTNVPANAAANFILIKVKNNPGTPVRQWIAPAPPAGGTNRIGVNDLTDTQTNSLLF